MNSTSSRRENNIYMKLLCMEKNNSTSVVKHTLEQKNFPYYRRVSVHHGQRIDLFVQCTIHISHRTIYFSTLITLLPYRTRTFKINSKI